MKLKTILLTFCLIPIFIIPQNLIAQICPGDSTALIDFFNSTNGPSWTYGNDWISNSGSFYGVSFNAWEGNCSRATRINLPSNNIAGTIPSSFGNMTELKYVELRWNNLSGPLPASIGNLTNMIRFSVGNSLEGPIPEGIGNWKNLTLLSLQGNIVGNFPNFVCTLPLLEQLDLSNNSISGSIPSSIGDLTNLVALYLAGNELDYPVPAELGLLFNLEILTLGANNYSGEIPPVIGSLYSLTSLDLTNEEDATHKFTGNIPSSFSNLTNLIGFGLYNNDLSGELPVSVLSGMTSLENLNLAKNNFTGEIPENINLLQSIKELDLSNNDLSGPIPSTIGELTNLRLIELDWNGITQIPEEIVNMSGLEIFSVSSNQLHDLPEFSGNNPNLYLYIDGNYLDFDDILPALDFAIYVYYANQNDIDLTRTIEDGKTLLTMNAGGEPEATYQWYYWSQEISGETSKTIETAESNDIFGYRCEAKHPDLPDLTLTGRLSRGSSCIEVGVFELCTDQEYWDFVEGDENKVETSGKVTINDLLVFEGTITVDILGATIKADGEFYMEEIPIAGTTIPKYTFCKGEYELQLQEDGKIQNFLSDKINEYGELCGFELEIDEMEILNEEDDQVNGISLDCKITIPGISGDCGDDDDEEEAEITLEGIQFSTEGVKLEGISIENLGFKKFKDYCLNELSMKYDDEDDIFEAEVDLDLPFFEEFNAGITLKEGELDSIGWLLETERSLPLGTTPIAVKGCYGHIGSITGDALDLKLGGIFTNTVSERFYKISAHGRTVWPKIFELGGNGKFMKPPGGDKPYQINGDINLVYDHNRQMFTIDIEGKIGTNDEETWLIDGEGKLKLFAGYETPVITGTMDGTMTLEKLKDKFPYNWINSMFSFPVQAGTNCKLIWGQTKSIIGDATFKTETRGPYKLHFVIDPDFSYGEEGFLFWTASIEEKSAKLKSESTVGETVENINIPEETDFSVIGVISTENAPASILKNPSGKTYTNTDEQDKVVYSTSDDGKEAFWTISEPEAGNWEITLQDPAENDSLLLFIQPKETNLEISLDQTGNNVTVSWDPESFTEGQIIYILLDENNTDFDGDLIAEGDASTGSISFELNDSLSNCSYYVFAQVLKNYSLSQVYADDMVYLSKSILDAPVILDVSYNTSSGLTEIFYENSNDMNTYGYILDVVDSYGDDSTYAILKTGGNFIELNIDNYESKTIKMTSYDQFGLLGCPSIEAIITNTGNAVFDNENHEKYILYPNPAMDRLNIRSLQGGQYTAEIINLSGQKLYQELLSGALETIDISTLKQGIYIVRLISEDNISSYKIIKH